MTIASSLMGGCGFSHEHVEDSCKSTCVKIWGLKTQHNWGYSKFNSCIYRLKVTSTEKIIYPVMG